MILAIIMLLVSGVLAINPDHWHMQIMWGEAAFILWLSFEIFKRVHLIPAIVFLYFGLLASGATYTPTIYSTSVGSLEGLFQTATARSFLFLLCVCIPFIFAKKEKLKDWGDAFIFFGFVNSIWMIFMFFKVHAATGMIGMDSVDGSFLAILFPVVLFSRYRIYAGIPYALALGLSGSSTVLGILCLQGLAYFLFYGTDLIKKLFGATAVIVLTAIFGGLVGPQLMNNNGRLDILIKTYDTFLSIEPSSIQKWFIGLGQASFLVLMPFVQGTTQPYFAWLHNEPAQIVFEQGLVGLFLVLVLYLVGLYKVKRSPGQFLAMLGAGAQSFLQPCFRYFIFAMLMAFICRISFETKSESIKEGII